MHGTLQVPSCNTYGQILCFRATNHKPYHAMSTAPPCVPSQRTLQPSRIQCKHKYERRIRSLSVPVLSLISAVATPHSSIQPEFSIAWPSMGAHGRYETHPSLNESRTPPRIYAPGTRRENEEGKEKYFQDTFTPWRS